MSYPWQRDRADPPTQETDISETASSTPTDGAEDGSVLTAAAARQPDDRPTDGPLDGPLDGLLDGPPYTGDPAVDAALAGAAAAQSGDPAEQLEAYVGTHRALQERLADSGA